MTAPAAAAPAGPDPPADAGLPPPLAPADLTFMLCVEDGILSAQALLLAGSIRRFAGPYRDCRILAVSPRPGRWPDPASLRALMDLGVEWRAPPLNLTGHAYGTINRIVAGSWTERQCDSGWLCLLDSDTLFAGAPDFRAHQASVRVQDGKGAATGGPEDPADALWAAAAAAAGIALDDLPMLTTVFCRSRIRAAYNGGYLLVRRDLGVLALTERVFFGLFGAGVAPNADAAGTLMTSTGAAGRDQRMWWGSSQIALSVALHARAGLVHDAGADYNIPLHLFNPDRPMPVVPVRPVLVHYHHLAAAAHRADFLARLSRIGCAPEVVDYVAATCAGLDFPLAAAETAGA